MISILIVDDSAFMRKALRVILERDPEIQVVAVAGDGEEALEMIRQHNPDVVTLDIEMPRMDGLACIQHIMTEMPRPVLMVSSLTSEGAEATLKSLEYGAVDFIVKQQMGFGYDLARLEKDLTDKIKTVAQRHVLRRPARFSSASAASGGRPASAAPTRSAAGAPGAATFVSTSIPSGRPVRDLVAIGVSTGGPPVVQKVLSQLPKDFPAALLIAQHMPATFTGPFAARLDSLCAITVKEAQDGDSIRPGTAYISPGGKHIRVAQGRSQLEVQVTTQPEDALYKPSANVLIESAGNVAARRTLGVVLTGMGSDGLEGVKVLKAKGGRALAQSDATCVVYGMPKAIVDAGLADEIVDVDDVALAIQVNLHK